MDAAEPPVLVNPPISRLPDDTLYTIFLLLRGRPCFPGESDNALYNAPLDTQGGGAESDERDESPSNAPYPPTWVTMSIILSHVCARWRTLALSSPLLWNFIPITGTYSNRMMVDAFTTRSLDQPLSVLLTTVPRGINGHIYDLLATASGLLDVAPRVEQMGIVLPPSQARIVLQTLASPTEYSSFRVRKLWLDAGLDGMLDGDPRPITLPTVDPLSFRFLRARYMPIALIAYRGLVHLELFSVAPLSSVVLLSTIRNSPQLQIIRLRISAFRRPGDSIPTSLVHLADLQELVLDVGGTERSAFIVLFHITFPPTTKVDLRFIGQLPSPLYKRSASLREIAATVERASMQVDPSDGLLLKSDEPPALAVGCDGSFFDVRPPWHLQLANVSRAQLCDVLFAVPLPALTELNFALERWDSEEGIPVSQDRFDALFSAVPTVVALSTRIDARYAGYVIAALGRPLHASVMVEILRPTFRCPRLRRWTILWCGRAPSIDDFWLVERCCAARAAAGVPIDRLGTTVKVPELVMGSLRRSVSEVVVLGDDRLYSTCC
ncbi:hypothetical protein C8Q77DRAFT_1093909 [Trametes polyzona]|nr:hypothetical protein C8Q77DRAFT_1093909 [Trametes polyzona]